MVKINIKQKLFYFPHLVAFGNLVINLKYINNSQLPNIEPFEIELPDKSYLTVW